MTVCFLNQATLTVFQKDFKHSNFTVFQPDLTSYFSRTVNCQIYKGQQPLFLITVVISIK